MANLIFMPTIPGLLLYYETFIAVGYGKLKLYYKQKLFIVQTTSCTNNKHDKSEQLKSD